MSDVIYEYLIVILTVDPSTPVDSLERLKRVSGVGINAVKEEECITGTRVSLLDQLQKWAEDPPLLKSFGWTE